MPTDQREDSKTTAIPGRQKPYHPPDGGHINSGSDSSICKLPRKEEQCRLTSPGVRGNIRGDIKSRASRWSHRMNINEGKGRDAGGPRKR
ncbi:hypothetical protein CEXT_593621 [Caerostris extrusa]|uniref:Uncharacterized protein n=1 Tax=Caerostris extrusa TaxID=172846 RepID=A0AAV4PZD4_CAEEX|nr:hypothetical protein CEXT_593621 [Caerostris extrusa]